MIPSSQDREGRAMPDTNSPAIRHPISVREHEDGHYFFEEHGLGLGLGGGLMTFLSYDKTSRERRRSKSEPMAHCAALRIGRSCAR